MLSPYLPEQLCAGERVSLMACAAVRARSDRQDEPSCARMGYVLSVTWSPEVLQEILHRYVAIDRRDAIQPAFDALLGVVDEVLAVDNKTVERAKQIVLEYRRLSARDAIHLSIMERHGIERILSFDSGFDSFPGITRLS